MNTQYVRHPLAVALALPPTEEQDEALRVSVQQHGVIHPVVILEGKILDGWSRYQAAKATKKELPTQDYYGESTPEGVTAFLLAVNIHRKHYTPLQRALLAARILDQRRGVVKGGPQEFSTKQASAMFHVSASYVNLCHRALLSKNASLIRDIETGTASREQIDEVLGRPTSTVKVVPMKPEPPATRTNKVTDALVQALEKLDEEERTRVAQAIYDRIKPYLKPKRVAA